MLWVSVWFLILLHLAVRGTHAEMQYSLMTFGIPVDHLPVDLDGKPIRKYHEDWLRSRRELESIRASTEREAHRSEKTHETITAAVTSSSSSSGTDTPITFHKDDVLLGREKVAQGHTGNFRFQYIIEEHWDEYDKILEEVDHKEYEVMKIIVKHIVQQKKENESKNESS